MSYQIYFPGSFSLKCMYATVFFSTENAIIYFQFLNAKIARISFQFLNIREGFTVFFSVLKFFLPPVLQSSVRYVLRLYFEQRIQVLSLLIT